MTNRQIYVRNVLKLYVQLPDTLPRARRSDRALADQFYHRQIRIETVEAALLLGSARRMLQYGPGRVRPAIRSLHYFQPIVEELRAEPLPAGYVDYLRFKMRSLTPIDILQEYKP